jgi:hypothetical protein
MHRFLLLPMCMLTSALALGCGDQPQLTAPGDLPNPSLAAERFIHLDAFLLGGDPGNPLALQAGFDAGLTAEDICAGDFGEGPHGLGQIVLTPSGGALLHSLGRDVNLVVYEFGAGPVTDGCQLVGAPVVGTGTGNFNYTVLATGHGAFTVHVTLQGTIDLVSGGQAGVFGTARVTVLPDGTLLFDEERVRLTPL